MIRFECKRLIGCCGVFSALRKLSSWAGATWGSSIDRSPSDRPANAVGGRSRLLAVSTMESKSGVS